jgi:hypothetical protein
VNARVATSELNNQTGFDYIVVGGETMSGSWQSGNGEWSGERGNRYWDWERDVRAKIARARTHYHGREVDIGSMYSIMLETIRPNSRAHVYFNRATKALQVDCERWDRYKIPPNVDKRPVLKEEIVEAAKDPHVARLEMLVKELQQRVYKEDGKTVGEGSVVGDDEEVDEKFDATGVVSGHETIHYDVNGVPLTGRMMIIEKLIRCMSDVFGDGGQEQSFEFRRIKQRQGEDLETYISRVAVAHRPVAKEIDQESAANILWGGYLTGTWHRASKRS